MKKTKKFDCVKMKHLGAKKVQTQIEGMTKEQEIKFWEDRSQRLRECQENVRRRFR